jgi:threonine/homoserine/homoserine lactone efflux protein
MGMEHLNQLLVVYAAYLIATASPGPSNMAIMGVAMSRGRRPALVLAAGVITGSMFWALLAATGISAVLSTYAKALFVIKIAGGLYLLYLAYKSAKSAYAPAKTAAPTAENNQPPQYFSLYRRGLMLHIGNPKAILAWIAIMSLGLKADAHSNMLPAIIGGCAILGVLVFCGYALLFSTAPMIKAYNKARRGIEATLALFFGFAGFRLLMSQS